MNSSYTLGEDNKKLPSECCPCCLFIWVHGINNSLGEAMNGFTSVENSYNGWCYVVGFAWYSDPKTRAGFNTLDFGVKKQAANQVATGAFTQFIKDFRTKCPDTRINLGGHSLGARVILKALSAGLKVGTVLLAAAAVDNESLKTEFSAAPANAERIYNGYNPSDKVLQFAYTAWEWDTALGEEGEETPVGGNVSSYKFTEWKTDHSGVYDQNVNRNYWDTFSSTTNGKCPAAESPANKGKQWK
ncbi:MAG: alpha/beta hydrolase [Bryobacteraceae bacterium]|nr:alpha/beta hydrolase [Bryobacteraceae bacterium]